MSSTTGSTHPPDRAERERALDAKHSVLVRAPAGSGKTDLLTRRFLLLLGEIDDPGEIVAITFTKAAAAEMRNRILDKLEEATVRSNPEATNETGQSDLDPFSMEFLARRALAHSEAKGWNLIDLPAQLRIDTIDAFCRELALQQPLLSRLGGGLDISDQTKELYRRAARRTLQQIGNRDGAIGEAIETLLMWRDNGWRDIEDQLVKMLETRDQWMHDFVLDRDPDWGMLRERLERPFAREVQCKLTGLGILLDQSPGTCDEVLQLARYACAQTGGVRHRDLAELAEFPVAPYGTIEALEEARAACLCVADLLLTQDGTFRKVVDVSLGFPKEGKAEKARAVALIADMKNVDELESALAGVRDLPPARYTDNDWRIVRACFVLLRHAAAELQVVFAEAGAADYTEVAQIAQHVLRGEEGYPSDTALAVADKIRHILVDEFQDTSRRQHRMLTDLITAWPGREGRTFFVVGDPKQSIYFFRDADAELFSRVEQFGLEVMNDLALRFESTPLSANFRTSHELVVTLNGIFKKILEKDDGSGVTFAESLPARLDSSRVGPQLVVEPAIPMKLHLEFIPATTRGGGRGSGSRGSKEIAAQRDLARVKQAKEIVELIRSHGTRIEEKRAAGGKFRVAVLGRTKKALAQIAVALREAAIPFRAVELEELKQRPEIIDALALARALLNPDDRVAWLGVLRAPWCGLSLADLHALTSADDAEVKARPIPELLAERLDLLRPDGQMAAQRVLHSVKYAQRIRFAHPTASPATWIEQVYLHLGGDYCVDATARTNINLLWNSLDALAAGEPDMLGPALDAALERLTAQPDPDANSDCGVQLMTIHKSKGLEFEVVIVPELEAITRRGKFAMLSWLERGIAEPLEAGEITEFLVAPVQSKGTERGNAKAWVDHVRCERESQELRRLLYVAATRARDELHFFACPAWREARDGSLELATPTNSLLATAWPAFEEEIRQRFDDWRAKSRAGEDGDLILYGLAAGAENDPDESPKPTIIRRLPPDFCLNTGMHDAIAGDAPQLSSGRSYERHEGGLLPRAMGKAVHTLMQQLAQLLATQSRQAALTALPGFVPSIAAEVRAAGVDTKRAGRIANQALEIVQRAAIEPVGRWILAPHSDAASEVRWAGVAGGKVRTVQVDRVFRAGDTPLIDEGRDEQRTWWIVDYKTAHEDGLDPALALPELRRVFAPQVETYATILRNLHGADIAIRAGLYYPRMLLLDWWAL